MPKTTKKTRRVKRTRVTIFARVTRDVSSTLADVSFRQPTIRELRDALNAALASQKRGR